MCKKDAKKKHTCFKNWKGASSSMELDIILEGFLAAEKQHGVSCINFVGDGDSSVYPTLVSNKPSYKGKHKLTETMRQKLTKAAQCAVIMRSKESNKHKAAELLQEDILNSPLHCFGSHHKCKADYCKLVNPWKRKTQIAMPRSQ